MKYNQDKHYRKSIRLKEYDYSQAGYYFVTICTHNMEHLFGEIIENHVVLNICGDIIREELLKTEQIRPNIKVDSFCIMPNHLHFIIAIVEQFIDYVGVHCNEPLQCNESLRNNNIEEYGKSTKRINQIRNTPGFPVWQRNYYEHIIRNDRELYEIRNYIEYNPINWNDDEYNI